MKNRHIFLLFFAITLVMTYPLVFTPFSFKVDELFDVGTQIWNFGLIKNSLLHWHIDPFRNDYMFYNQGSNFIVQNPVTFYALLSIPFQVIMSDLKGIALSMNLILLFSTALTGYGVYLYGIHRGMSRSGAFVAGLILAFCPFRFWHMGRFHITSTEFLPFFLLIFEKSLHERAKSTKYAAICGLIFALTVYTSLIYATYTSLLAFIVLLWEVSNRRVTLKDAVKPLAMMIVVALVLSSFFLYEFILYLASQSVEIGEPVEAMSKYSANLMGYVIPSSNLKLFGALGYINYALKGIGGNELYAGLFTIILAGFALRKTKREGQSSCIWAVTLIVFLIISLGPNLNALATQSDWHMPQYYLARYLPMFGMDRAPVRYAIIVQFSLAMLAGYGVTRLGEVSIKDSWKKLMPAVISALILVDFFQAPLKMRAVSVPGFYHEIAADKEDFGIFELPHQLPLTWRYSVTYQVVHHKKLVLYAGRSKIKKYQVMEHPFFYNLISPKELINNPDRDRLIEANRVYLKEMGIKYIVLHERLAPPEYIGPWKEYIELHQPVKTLVEGSSRAYRMY